MNYYFTLLYMQIYMNCNEIIKSKEKETQNKFTKIKSDFFIQMIFDDIPKRKYLEIIKHNLYMKKRLNVEIKNYKEYCETFTSIDIEIIPTKFKVGNFINISEENKKYIHIYFNKDKKEINVTNLNRIEYKVFKIKIIIDHQIKSFSKLFKNCECIESIKFTKFYRNNIETMNEMFCDCISLKEINFYQFNTMNVRNMAKMFSGCLLLEKLNISNFNTINVVDMREMFSRCYQLNKLNLSNFDTSNTTNMNCMFFECTSLTELNISNFNTRNVTNMRGMFYMCKSLHELDLSSFNTNKVKDMSNMFEFCNSLIELNISNFSINDETNISGMFLSCQGILKYKIRNQFSFFKDLAFEDKEEYDNNFVNTNDINYDFSCMFQFDIFY